MSPNSEFLALCFVAALLFGTVVVFGMKASANRQRSALRETKALNVHEEVAQAFPISDLLYGIWQIGLTEVRLLVNDCNDLPVGAIVKETMSTSIEIEKSRYVVIPGATWNKTADLVAHDSRQLRARFERLGSLLRPVGKFSFDGGRVLTLRKHSEFRSLISIYDGQEQVGWVRDLHPGGVRVGRAISLPKSIPMEVKFGCSVNCGNALALREDGAFR